ncbi:MAG: hypothetical protein R8K49_07495 [Mariprofundaceae bacterium]
MSIKDFLYYGAMTQEQTNDVIEQFNVRWKRLNDIQNDLADRFVDSVLNRLSDSDSALLMAHIERVLAWQKDINDSLDSAESKHLSEYAFHLKNTTLIALRLCREYEVYNDIESFNYNAETQVVELNDEDLYFLG